MRAWVHGIPPSRREFATYRKPRRPARRERLIRHGQDWSEDLTKISVPVLAMNGDADQVVPHDTSGPRAVKLVKNGTLKTYPGFPHGMLTTHADVLNPDLLAFVQS